MKIEKLAGIPGTPKAELAYGGEWMVVQEIPGTDDGAQLYGPFRKTEQSAIRAWNTMVRRIRKANAGEVQR